MGFGGRLTALLVTLAATVAGTAVVALPEAVGADPSGTATVTLRVLDADGRGSPGTVKLWREDGDGYAQVPGAAVTTAGDGWVRISQVPHDVELTLSSGAPSSSEGGDTASVETFLGGEQTAYTADWFSVPGNVTFLRLPSLRRQRAVAVSGTVTDLQGRPWSAHERAVVRSWVRTPGGLVPGPTAETQRGESAGSFRMNGLWPGSEVTVGVVPDGAPVTGPAYLGGASTLDDARFVTTREKRTVSVGRFGAPFAATWVTGRAVDDDGLAVSGAEVTHVYLDYTWSPRGSVQGTIIADTDGDGRFGVHVLPGDTAKFRVRSPESYDEHPWVGGGTSWETAGAYTPDGRAEMTVDDVVLPRAGAVLRGRVVGKDGRPVVGASVFTSGATSQLDSFRADTDDAGLFELVGVPFGSEVKVWVSDTNTGRTGSTDAVVGEEALVTLPDIVARTERAVVTARVVSDDSIHGVELSLVDLDTGNRWGVRTVWHGHASVAVPPGRYGVYGSRRARIDHDDRDSRVDWWWGGGRPDRGSPFEVVVTGGDDLDLGELRMDPPTLLTGHVRDSAGVGLGGATLTLTMGNGFSGVQIVRTDDDGEYAALIPDGATVEIAAQRELPTATYPTVVRGTPGEPIMVQGDRQVEDVVLRPVWQPTVGTVAGIRDEVCLQNRASELTTGLGLRMTYGALTWSGSVGQDWTRPSPAVAVIAPLMLPSTEESEELGRSMSWGEATDGSLCFLTVTPDVTHQVWISAPGDDGRVTATINYDHVHAPADRFGREQTVVAGWSDGRKSVVLPGAGHEGDYDDDGRYALIKGSRGSGHPGRYVFDHIGFQGGVSVENVEPPSISGTARPGETLRVDPGSWTVDGVPSDALAFTYTWTNRNGETSGPTRRLAWEDGSTTMDVTVEAVVPGPRFPAVARATVEVEAATDPNPVDVTTSHGTTSTGLPIVLIGETQLIVVHGCGGVAQPTYTLDYASPWSSDVSGPMTPGPVDENGIGEYAITIEHLYVSGVARIRTNVPESCEPGSALVSVTIYVDPAGTITDQWGVPVDHATAALFRSDTEQGDYSVVPDGSDVMSPSNQVNPMTAYDGVFRWDVTPGWYQVRASASGCGTRWGVPMEVPPARISLLIKMPCTYRTPEFETHYAGTREVGGTVSATFDTDVTIPDAVVTTQWYRDGVPIPGATGSEYTLGPYDVGREVKLEQRIQRRAYVPDDGRGRPVTFEPAVAEAYWFLRGDPIPLPDPTPPPTPTPPAIPTQTPTAAPSSAPTPAPSPVSSRTALRLVGSNSGRARVRVVVRATGAEPTGVVQIRERGRVVGRASLRPGDGGRVVVPLVRLRVRGGHRIVATYLGSTAVLPSTSPRVRLRA
ncbi:hypothetical protein [Nocardioides sp.]|uniref:hypothetical protein n=1 Tax=Nocardioides sp. TaxID=35761 RepID=UPI0035B44D45